MRLLKGKAGTNLNGFVSKYYTKELVESFADCAFS